MHGLRQTGIGLGRIVEKLIQRSIHHDYHGRGIYLITLCTEGRKPLLGTLVGSSLDEAAIAPTALGHEVLRCWEQIPEVQRQLAAEKAAKTGLPCDRDITLLEYQLMPDHFHGIIFVRKDMDIALGDIIRGFMVGCTKAFNDRDPREYALHPT
jgi:REP element-mobilizing transposase RayT